jgi:malonyl CoA-acyl carrier protein transacylase
MAVVLGLDADSVEQMVQEINLPDDLWAANFNCPGQVVISGTVRGIEAGTAAAKAGMATREVNARWQADMAPFFVALDGKNPDEGFLLLEEVFHLD